MMTIEELAKELNTVRTERNRLTRREKELVEELYQQVFDKDSYKPKEVETTDYILLIRWSTIGRRIRRFENLI